MYSLGLDLLIKLDSQPYQDSPRHVAYALQKPFNKEAEWLQQLDIITPLGTDEKWCNSFTLVPKPNRKVRLCFDSSRLNQALICSP